MKQLKKAQEETSAIVKLEGKLFKLGEIEKKLEIKYYYLRNLQSKYKLFPAAIAPKNGRNALYNIDDVRYIFSLFEAKRKEGFMIRFVKQSLLKHNEGYKRLMQVGEHE